jgi:hypothetical protein
MSVCILFPLTNHTIPWFTLNGYWFITKRPKLRGMATSGVKTSYKRSYLEHRFRVSQYREHQALTLSCINAWQC